MGTQLWRADRAGPGLHPRSPLCRHAPYRLSARGSGRVRGTPGRLGRPGSSGVCPPRPETPELAVALDGKTLRGSKKQGAPGTHLLSALAHQIGVTLAQHAVDDKTNEITAVETLLQPLVLEGRLVTMDALLTQRHIAQTIVDKGGDYVMIVKENQPQSAG